MKKYDIIAFDLDGTLTNPEHGLICSFVYALGKMGVDYGEKSALKRFIGPPIYEQWQIDFGFTPEKASVALDTFREFYEVYGWWDNEVYPGIEQMLRRLCDSGKILVVATSKPEQTAKKVLSLFELDKYFHCIAGASMNGSADGKSQILSRALHSVGLENPDECILVGDRKYDAEGAAQVGCDSLGVLWGHGSALELRSAGFTYIADSPDEVAEILS
jgi:phosphoglycolate phosphatase